MIYSRLHGRLGNQMFQYAAGRALALRLGVEVALDFRSIASLGRHAITQAFDLPLATPDSLPPHKDDAPLRYAAWRAFGRNPRFVRERGLGYNPRFETLGDATYLHGYWQSERYFAPVADRIRADFTFGAFASPACADMAARIGGTPGAISLHVRRGDYTTLPGHALCSQSYYEKALARVLEGMSEDPVVFVFSDEPDWARTNLPLPFDKVVVDINADATDYEDMRLMSLCRHNICANSSFSWWAAWLNANPGKRVVTPSRWYAAPKTVNRDIWPDGWLRVDV